MRVRKLVPIVLVVLAASACSVGDVVFDTLPDAGVTCKGSACHHDAGVACDGSTCHTDAGPACDGSTCNADAGPECDGSTCACDGSTCAPPDAGPPCDTNACIACTTTEQCALFGAVCVSGRCLALCADGMLDGSETDIDCGGGTCQACAIGKRCTTSTDCASQYCLPDIMGTATCQDPAGSNSGG